MTALVGVLNKHAVAIAADSAVTMGNTHKVINSANKIFTLSKYHPVAVMTYNNASFMGVPWDIIIKEYRKNLGEKSFHLLEEYSNDFIYFLHKRNFFSGEKTHRRYLLFALDTYYKICCNEICKEKKIEYDSVTVDLIESKLEKCLKTNKAAEKCEDFKSYDFVAFTNYFQDSIKEYAKNKKISNHTLLTESFFYYITAKFSDPIYTGLVFVGYGESEIYPSLLSFNISIGFDGKLKYSNRENAKITEDGPEAIIIPFAQTDVTLTIMRGINPSFQSIIQDIIAKSIRLFLDQIADIVDKRKELKDVSSAIKRFDTDGIIGKIVLDINKEMRKSYTYPLINTVINLDKEDMANMAESFIALTSLVRRMQPHEETVGGPVDVAVISKGDGFVWINRKHYFKPELNSHFFNNYFK